MNSKENFPERPDTRQHILDCGQRLIARKGFVGVGLAEILTSAGVPKGSFYHYFASKEAFGVALLEGYFADYLERMDHLMAASGSNGGRCVMGYFQRWVETQRGDDDAQKCLITKLGAEIADLSEPMRATMQRGTENIRRRLTESIHRGTADGSICATMTPEECTQWLYSAWLGATMLAKLQGNGEPLETALAMTRRFLAIVDDQA